MASYKIYMKFGSYKPKIYIHHAIQDYNEALRLLRNERIMHRYSRFQPIFGIEFDV